jgi:hypothetical protein
VSLIDFFNHFKIAINVIPSITDANILISNVTCTYVGRIESVVVPIIGKNKTPTQMRANKITK